MDEIKRKISEEFDASGDAELSDDLKQEIESSGELKGYADDLIKVEGFLHNLRDVDHEEPEWDSLHEDISKTMDETGESEAALFEAPMPDGSEDDSMPAQEPVPEPAPEPEEPREEPAEPVAEEKPEPALIKPVKPEEEEEPHLRMTAAKAVPEKGESSGLIPLGELLAKHKENLAAAGVSALDAPSAILGVPPQRGGRTMYIAIAAGVLVVLGIAVALGYSRMRRAEREASAGAQIDMEALREQLKEELKEEYKQQILAELKATGMSTAEAEAAAERQAEELAAAEAERQAEEMAESEGEEETLAIAPSGKKKKRKKKKGSGGSSAGLSAPSGPAPKSSGYSPKKPTSSKKGPKTAGDDLAALLEGATSGKKKSQYASSKKPSKEPPKPKPTGGGLPTTTSKPPPANIPKTLAKADIRKTMNKIKPRMLKCGEGKIGTLMLALVVTSDGKVKSAKVTGKFATDPAGKCAEKVAKTAKFPPFQNPTASVTYPFVFAPKPGQ
jgi:hypothetical protein